MASLPCRQELFAVGVGEGITAMKAHSATVRFVAVSPAEPPTFVFGR
jgi:hypothetical protein